MVDDLPKAEHGLVSSISLFCVDRKTLKEFPPNLKPKERERERERENDSRTFAVQENAMG